MKAELACRMTCQHRDAVPCLIFPTSDRRVSSLVSSGIMEASFHSMYCNLLQDPHSAIIGWWCHLEPEFCPGSYSTEVFCFLAKDLSCQSRCFTLFLMWFNNLSPVTSRKVSIWEGVALSFWEWDLWCSVGTAQTPTQEFTFSERV